MNFLMTLAHIAPGELFATHRAAMQLLLLVYLTN
jgi:hypothetical protein